MGMYTTLFLSYCVEANDGWEKNEEKAIYIAYDILQLWLFVEQRLSGYQIRVT